MAETSMRSTVVQTLKKFHAIAVENPAFPGTPDVNFIEGWLELKYLSAWPKHKDTPVRVKHFKANQRLWIRERAEAGGKVYIVLQVRFEWLILPPLEGAQRLGFATKDELLDLAVLHFPHRFNPVEFVQFLCQ